MLKKAKIMGKNSSKSYLRAQPRRQSEREMSPTRNPFPVQAKKREIPGIKKKNVNQSIENPLHFMVFSLFIEFQKCSISTLEIGVYICRCKKNTKTQGGCVI